MNYLQNTILSFFLLLTFTACSSGQNKKVNVTNPIKFEEAGAKFEGTLMLPKNFEKKIPLVIVVHEWWGKNDYSHNRAQMLTEQGYAALVVDLYGNGQTATNPTDAQALATPFYKDANLGVSRLKKYLEIASKDPHVDAEKIYAIGYCFGGTQVLNLARSGAAVKGVVSFHGGLGTSIKSIDNMKTNVLVLNGAADPMVPAKDIAAFKKEMKKVKANLRFVDYPGALHAFTNPAATEVGKTYKMPVAYDEKADKASWQELLTFLKK
jgi:dienelactone hydrolase